MENEDITALFLGLCEITKRQAEAVRDLQLQVSGLKAALTGYNRPAYDKAVEKESPGIEDALSPSLNWLDAALQRLGGS